MWCRRLMRWQMMRRLRALPKLKIYAPVFGGTV
jgi:hypothetical protein